MTARAQSGAPTPAAPMRAFAGTSPFRGYTFGPCFRWEGFGSVEALLRQGQPVVLFADYLGKRELESIEMSRVVAFVTEHGSPLDPMWWSLATITRPSVVGARGVLADARPGDLAIIDGVAMQVVLRPTPAVLARHKALKGTAPPVEPKAVRELLTRLCEPITQAWQYAGRVLPYDCPEQRKLYEISWKLAHRKMPTPEEDDLVRRLLFADGRAEAAARYRPPAAHPPPADGEP